MSAFLDLPGDAFEATATFWQRVTGSTRSVTRGDTGQFATLLPADGDAYLRVQRVDDGPAHVHLDLHVDDVASAARRAEALGATRLRTSAYVTLTSPAGLTLCIVPHRGEATRPAPVVRSDGATELVDQVAIDVPATRYDEEGAFWAGLTGWAHHATARPEFTYLERPPGQPLRLLLHRLGDDDTATSARAHLDLAAGPDVERAQADHLRHGATHVARGARWLTMADPAGLPYCLTERDPVTGTLTT